MALLIIYTMHLTAQFNHFNNAQTLGCHTMWIKQIEQSHTRSSWSKQSYLLNKFTCADEATYAKAQYPILSMCFKATGSCVACRAFTLACAGCSQTCMHLQLIVFLLQVIWEIQFSTHKCIGVGYHFTTGTAQYSANVNTTSSAQPMNIILIACRVLFHSIEAVGVTVTRFCYSYILK